MTVRPAIQLWTGLRSTLFFYKDNEIIGVGCGTFNMRTMDRKHTVTKFSTFSDYDYLEVYIT